MQSTKGASPARELASSIADAIQAVLRDVRRQVEMCSSDSSGLASLQAPLRRGNALVADLRAYAGVQRLTSADVEILPLLCSFADALGGVLDRRTRSRRTSIGNAGPSTSMPPGWRRRSSGS